MRRYLTVGLLALCTACSNSGSTLVKDVQDSSTLDSMHDGELPLTEVVADVTWDAAFDLPPVDLTEVMSDAFQECEPGSGCPYESCMDNADCLSGFCLPHLGDKVCSPPCIEDCAPGFSCVMPDWVGPDVLFLCLSDVPSLCRPCTESSDCQGYAVAPAVCMLLDGEGQFCSSPCQSDGACPAGFTCLPTTTVEGANADLCVPTSGDCPCTDTSVALSASTPCFAENSFGLCAGSRVCTVNGLTACDATTPAADECNGLDDDCDGDIDEDTCNDDNGCTNDSCLGSDGCLFEPQTGTECVDDDPCTIADHCENGLCIGSPLVCDDANPCTDDSCQGDQGCIYLPNSQPCDDSEPCTVQDQCNQGTCAGYALDCHCEFDSDCAVLEDGDLCNGVLECDTSTLPFVCVVKPGTVIDCPAPTGVDAFCNATSCDPVTGECSFAPANQGLACNDTDACTIGETCIDGVCIGDIALNCNDGNDCTDDGCDNVAGCYHLNNTTVCNDSNPCTTVDLCAGGECLGSAPLFCDDGNPCTTDTCDPATGCIFQGNVGPCDDNNACTLDDQCANGSCQAGSVMDCDDGNLCTSDSCSPATGCAYTFNLQPCDDGDPCTNGDTCSQGQCAPGAPLDCNDNNSCTDDGCSDGLCEHLPNNSECSDNNACTVGDKCVAGTCTASASLYCNDDNVCTDDFCDLKQGCVHLPNQAPCSDGSLCTVEDTCSAGECLSGQPMVCSDSNPCTDDSCVPESGCLFEQNTSPCDDGDACTLNDICAGGICTGGNPLACDDGNPCTDDSCVPESGCLFQVNAAPCDDGNACTPVDLCANAACVGAGDLDCDDGLFCNGSESCAPEQGCVIGQAPELDDGIPCTADACDEDNDLVTHTPDDGLCPEAAHCQPELAPAETCIYPLGHQNNPGLSCKAILDVGDATGDGLYWIDPEGDGSPFKALCDMSTDGGGWTRVVVIRNNSIAHGDNIGSTGDVAVDGAPSKLADETINQLNTVGYWRFNCSNQSRFVKNVNNIWTSKKVNGENWSMDRNKDLNFECPANRSGYVLSDYPSCSAGHLNYVAEKGLLEGGGCYYANEGWNRNGSLWAR